MAEIQYAFTDEEGVFLVKLARESLEYRLEHGEELPEPDEYPPNLQNNSGIFVTLRRYGISHGETLRGCIGMIEAREPIIQGAIHMAIAAGLDDPRFPPVKKSELDNLVFEITAMTVPALLAGEGPKDLDAIRGAIVIGRDGLIMARGWQRGLFLPQVPVEQGWDIDTYLNENCRKAGLPYGAWKEPYSSIYTFTGEIFEEEEPRGNIVRKVLVPTS
jgi:hypothetical protein